MKEQEFFLNSTQVRIRKIRKIVKDFEMDKKDYWMSSVAQPSVLFVPFMSLSYLSQIKLWKTHSEHDYYPKKCKLIMPIEMLLIACGQRTVLHLLVNLSQHS